MINMLVVIKEERLKAIFKNDWEACSSCETTRLIKAIKTMLAGMIRN